MEFSFFLPFMPRTFSVSDSCQCITNLSFFSISRYISIPISNYQPNKNNQNWWLRPLDHCTTCLPALPLSCPPPHPTLHSPDCFFWNTNFLSDYIQLLLKSSNNSSHLLTIKYELLTWKTWFVVHLPIPYHLLQLYFCLIIFARQP